MKILYINSCVRKESRTNILAKYLLSKLNGDIKELKLDNSIKPLDEEALNKRQELQLNKKYDSKEFELAKEFRDSDIIVISSPHWDYSFSAILKVYFENINCNGVTFGYNDKGELYSLCKAKSLYYVTTSGGYIVNDEYSFGYVKALANSFFGIKDVKYIKAEGLDIEGNDSISILNKAKEEIDKIGEKLWESH